jgi:hypothetical protein
MSSKIITYRMAPENSFYESHVMRVVTQDLGGIIVVLSETTTGMTIDEFLEKYPKQKVDGRSAESFMADVSRLTDEQLAEMGLKRVGGTKQAPKPEREEEVIEPTFNYPIHEGYGWYQLSNGLKAKGKEEAVKRQGLLDDGDPVKFDQRDLDEHIREIEANEVEEMAAVMPEPFPDKD